MLVIDPTGPGAIDCQLFHNQKHFNKLIVGRGENLLPALDQWFRQRRLGWAQVTGVVVITGGNRFSLQRQAVVIANTLGYALNIPAAAMPIGRASSPITPAEIKRSLKDKYGYAPVRATYSQAPNISKPKAKQVS